MAVSDRVMGDPYKRYNPMQTTVGPDQMGTIEYPSDMNHGLSTIPQEITITTNTWKEQNTQQLDRFKKLDDNSDYIRLYKALLSGH